MSETVVVLLDGSEMAEQALPTAKEIARGTGSEILLLRAVPPLEYASDWMVGSVIDRTMTARREVAVEYLQRVRMSLERDGYAADMDTGVGCICEIAESVLKQRPGAAIVISSRWGYGSDRTPQHVAKLLSDRHQVLLVPADAVQAV